MYKSTPNLDAVICAAGPAKFGPLGELTEEDFYVWIRGKMMGQINLVRIGQIYLNAQGSFTLTTGILADDPIVGSSEVTDEDRTATHRGRAGSARGRAGRSTADVADDLPALCRMAGGAGPAAGPEHRLPVALR